MRIYGISGLGADERVFDKVNQYLQHPITFVPWIAPEQKESLKHYALRMAKTLDTSQPFTLVGVSFGGMIATEMNKVIHPDKTVIISSAASKKELPLYFRGIGKLNLVPHIPKRFLTIPDPLIDVVGSVKKADSKALVHDIMKKTDKSFLRWAIQSILTWDNSEIPKNLKRIHGKADRLLPIKAETDHLLDGGHLVIMEKPEEISRIIEKELTPA